jgi:hypothetical protein
MEQSPCWGANSFSASQKNSLHILQPTVSFPFHNSPPIHITQRQTKPHHALPHYYYKIHFIILSPMPRSSKWSLSFRFFQQTPYAFLVSLTHTTRFTHLVLLDIITQMMFGEQYKSWNSLLCSPLQSPVTSFLWGTNIFLSTLLLNTVSLCVSPPLYKTRTKQQAKLQFWIF